MKYRIGNNSFMTKAMLTGAVFSIAYPVVDKLVDKISGMKAFGTELVAGEYEDCMCEDPLRYLKTEHARKWGLNGTIGKKFIDENGNCYFVYELGKDDWISTVSLYAYGDFEIGAIQKATNRFRDRIGRKELINVHYVKPGDKIVVPFVAESSVLSPDFGDLSQKIDYLIDLCKDYKEQHEVDLLLNPQRDSLMTVMKDNLDEMKNNQEGMMGDLEYIREEVDKIPKEKEPVEFEMTGETFGFDKMDEGYNASGRLGYRNFEIEGGYSEDDPSVPEMYGKLSFLLDLVKWDTDNVFKIGAGLGAYKQGKQPFCGENGFDYHDPEGALFTDVQAFLKTNFGKARVTFIPHKMDFREGENSKRPFSAEGSLNLPGFYFIEIFWDYNRQEDHERITGGLGLNIPAGDSRITIKGGPTMDNNREVGGSVSVSIGN